MYVADHLSRAYLRQTEDSPKDEFQVFALELEEINSLEAVKITSERLSQLQKATEQDPVMQALKNTILIGWPDTKDQVPLTVRDYWNFREELTLHNGVLFKNQRIIIPHSLRSEMIARLHSSHLGTEACFRKTRDRIFWPDMTTQIKEAVAKCDVCAEYQTANPQQPMQTHKILERPWSRVGADPFSLYSKVYIVLVDNYSDFVEIDLLKNTNSSAVIKFLKAQFSRHGIPEVLVTDNGPQFVSGEFSEFATQWEFQHVTSSPYHPKSNGKAESAVKVVKSRLFKKAQRDNKDLWLSLLDYRNTPTTGMQTSPAQRLMSRRTKILVSISTNLLYLEVPEGVQHQIQRKSQMAKIYHDRNVKVLPDLEIGQEVRLALLQRGRPWKAGNCVEKLSDRSYMVKADGELFRRNRHDLKPTQENPTADRPEPVSQSTSESYISPAAAATPASSPVVRRTSPRDIKRPARFADFVC